MKNLDFADFIICFRKQFVFQKGRGGRRISPYHTAQNYEQGLKCDTWAMIVFIYCGTHYGFSDEEMLAELRIKPSLYEVLKESTPAILKRDYDDYALHMKVITKIKLVYHHIWFTHRVDPYKEVKAMA